MDEITIPEYLNPWRDFNKISPIFTESKNIDILRKSPLQNILVYLSEEFLGSKIHTARLDSNNKIITVGGLFYFDLDPIRITHWKYMTDDPETELNKYKQMLKDREKEEL